MTTNSIPPFATTCRCSRPVACCLGAILLAILVSAVLPPSALAGTPAPGWEVSSVAQPTNFTIADNALCARTQLFFCDRYVVTVTNVGSGPTTAPVVITDTLPPGLTAIELSGGNLEEGVHLSDNPPWTCKLATTTCTYSGQAQPGTTLVMSVEVKVTSAVAGPITNTVKVSGGGARSVSTSEPLTLPNTVNKPEAAFGISSFGFEAHDAGGLLDSQADDHPYGVTSTVGFNTSIHTDPNGELVAGSIEPPKNIAVYLPLGFLGDPTAAAQCTETELSGGGNRGSECPPTSRVGTFVFVEENIVSGTVVPGNVGGEESAVYNMVPQKGYPAQLGFKVVGIPITLYGSLVHTPSGYALRVASPGLPIPIHIEGAALTLFGDPKTADGEPGSPQSFFTNPNDCTAGALKARLQVDSWEAPRQWITGESVAYPSVTGCNLLQFEPRVEMHPETTEAEGPSGYEIKLKIPQSPERFSVLATPQLKDLTMTLPEGMTLSPGGGDGLVGCEATGPHGIDMPTGGSTPTDVGAGAQDARGEAIGQDGMTQLVPGHCPQASQVGTVQVVSPVLRNPLEGHLYVAQPRCGRAGQPGCTSADATNGNLFGLYLEAGSEEVGAVVKLAGSASVNPATGQITARFLENPQLPVSEVLIQLRGGQRAPLANPRQCGEAVANSDLTAWSSPMTPDAIAPASFPVDWDGNDAPCPATLPFAPTLLAGPTNATAGHFSPFTLTLSRGDRQQDLSRLQIHLPPGLLGMLSKVSPCGEPQAAQSACGEASQIGTVNVAAGSGSHPLWVTGKVYLTGPYEGAPFGLSVVVPAVAGPFNLGNVTVRSRIDIDPDTSAVTITSDPLPQLLDGVPLRIQKLNVAVTREGFMLNPTRCSGMQVTASVAAEQGAAANLSTPITLEGCRRLPFAPTFKASTSGRTSKAQGASLDVKVTSAPGQANIARVVVRLPKQLPARLTTLQKACTEATFAQNPALCPPQSLVGIAKALTPVLSEAVSGPVYLVSHGGRAFPDVVVILQGEGVRVNLTGNTDIKGRVTTSTFASVPDVPVSSFELRLPQGSHSALSSNLPAKAKGSFCAGRSSIGKLVMPTTITGQNGAQITQSTKIAVAGCPKAKPATRKK